MGKSRDAKKDVKRKAAKTLMQKRHDKKEKKASR